MQKYIFILTLLISTTFLFGQNEEEIKAINKVVELINKDSTYIKKVLDNDQWLENGTDNGSELTAYFKNGQVVKIIEWVGLSNYTSIYEYYLYNNSLIFVYGQEKVFKYDNKTDSFDYNIQTVICENRYYFNNEKLINSEFSGETRNPKRATNDYSNNLLVDCKKYLKLFLK
jgi:hypothetical protein